MAMLAERRRKQKWSLNPRGKDWSKDTNKFGQKLMEKMGWSEGKGLGVKENGITENIKVAYKNDSRGMGFKESDDQWTQHESDFSDLLNTLTNSEDKKDTDSEIKLNSLEKKSQNSRARVHYHKFTRGKDLTRYSEKDLANIFGKKTLKKPEKNTEPQTESIKIETEEQKHGVDTLNRGSMLDYFKTKLTSMGKVAPMSTNNSIDRNSESESEMTTGFGFGFKPTKTEAPKSTFPIYVKPTRDISNDESKKRKPEDVTEDSKKKKSKKSKKQPEISNGISNIAFDPNFNTIAVEKHSLNTIEENSFEESASEISLNTSNTSKNLKKSKKFSKLNVSQTEDHSSWNVEDTELETSQNASKSGKSSKKNKTPAIIEDKIEETSFLSSEETPKRKKNKKDKQNKTESVLENTEEVIQSEETLPKKKKSKSNNKDTVEIEQEIPDKKGKKSKKSKVKIVEENKISLENNFVNPAFEDFPFNASDSIETPSKKLKKKTLPEQDTTKISKTTKSPKSPKINNNFEEALEKTSNKSKKKTKKPKDNGIQNEAFNQNFFDVKEQQNNFFEITPKQKKRKKEKYAIENPNFDTSNLETNENEIVLNPMEVPRSKKSKKNPKNKDVQLGIDNPALKLNDSSCSLQENTTSDSLISNDLPVFDLMLNVVTTPIIKKDTKLDARGLKRKKSVRFSNFNEERIITETGDLSRIETPSKKQKLVYENGGYDKIGNSIEENINTISKTLDTFQAEVENDLNEAKEIDVMVGEIGDPNGENEALPNGAKLKFKYAHFGKLPPWTRNQLVSAKKSYRHLIKGDITVEFKGTNMHEIKGYATKESIAFLESQETKIKS